MRGRERNEEVEEGAGRVRKGQGPLSNFLLVHPAPRNPPAPGASQEEIVSVGLGNRKHFGELPSKGDCWPSKASKGQSGAGREKEQG